jgi:hypothetical protein
VTTIVGIAPAILQPEMAIVSDGQEKQFCNNKTQK